MLGQILRLFRHAMFSDIGRGGDDDPADLFQLSCLEGRIRHPAGSYRYVGALLDQADDAVGQRDIQLDFRIKR
ncbi:hypothetical protein D3C80_2003510 [compost metagenome]